MLSGFYSEAELAEIGFKSYGSHVLISRKASIYKPEVIALGSHVRVDDFCILSGGTSIEVGSFIHIGAYSALFGGGGILMEDFSGMSPRCSLHSESDDGLGRSLTGPTIPMKYKPRFSKAPILMRRHAALATGCTVMPGVEFMEGSGAGAHSLVLKDCEAWTIYSGVPAKKLMRRSKQMLEIEKKFLDDVAAGIAYGGR